MVSLMMAAVSLTTRSPNVTALHDPRQLKWLDLVAAECLRRGVRHAIAA